jgi:hypothetical protein
LYCACFSDNIILKKQVAGGDDKRRKQNFLVYFCGAIVIALLVCFVLGPRLVR